MRINLSEETARGLQRLLHAQPLEPAATAPSRPSPEWPRMQPAIVTDAITQSSIDEEDRLKPGVGRVHLYAPFLFSIVDDEEQWQLLKTPEEQTPIKATVFRIDRGGEIPEGQIGYVAEDPWGRLWWVGQPVRFFVGTTSAAIAAGASGDVTATGLWDNAAISAKNEATGAVGANKKVGVSWDDLQQIYVITMEFC